MTAKATIPKSEIDKAIATCVAHGVPMKRIVFDWREGRVTVDVGQPEDGDVTGYEKVNWRE